MLCKLKAGEDFVYLFPKTSSFVLTKLWPSQPVLVVKNPPANAEDIRDVGSIPGSGDPPEEGMATQSSILAWRIPQTEEPSGLQPIESQRVKDD